MKLSKVTYALAIVVITELALSGMFLFAQDKLKLIDPKATKETKALYSNLYKLATNHILFGHLARQNYQNQKKNLIRKKSGTYPNGSTL